MPIGAFEEMGRSMVQPWWGDQGQQCSFVSRYLRCYDTI